MNKQNQKQRLPHGGSGRHLLRVLTALIITLTCIIPKAYSQKVYATFDETNGILNLGYGKDLPDGAVEIDADKTDGNWIASEAASSENVKKIIIDESFAEFEPSSCKNWFYGLTNLTEINGIENINTANVTDMSNMFEKCSSLISLDLSSFDTKNVQNMEWMFSGCSSLTNLDLSNFDTANNTSTSGMFADCSSLTSLDLSNFSTKNVTSMKFMFYNCESLTSLDLNSFNTDKVENMKGMFQSCKNLSQLLDLSNFNTENVTDISYMFNSCFNLKILDLSNFNTEKVTTMESVFYFNYNLKEVYVSDKWSTSSVQKSNYMFSTCNKLKGGKGTVFDENYTDASYARIDGGESAPGYFTSSEDKPSATTYAIFDANTNTLTIGYGKYLPDGAVKIDAAKTDGNWIASEILENFPTTGAIENIIIDESFAQFEPSSCKNWFSGLSDLTEIKGIENINTANVTDMSGMFQYCRGITNLDLSSFNTENVTNMSNMFAYSFCLVSLNLGSFNTAKVTDMSSMFKMDVLLETIYVGDEWTTKSLSEESWGPFYENKNLVGGKGTYDFAMISNPNANAAFAHIDGGENNPGFLTKVGESKPELNIEIKTLPQTEFFVGESFKYSDAEIYFIIENRQPQKIDNQIVTYSGYDNTKLGKQTITVKLSGVTTTYEITVTDKDAPYAIDNEEDNTVTFYYGKYKDGASVIGELVTPNAATAEKIIFDKSFANYKPTDCTAWFYGYSSITEIVDMEKYLNTEDVTLMGLMFMDCRNLKSLDLSHFDTKNVKRMDNMFYGCGNLKTVYISDEWSTSSVEQSISMFSKCVKLYGGKGTGYDNEHTDLSYARIDGGESAPGYFTKSGETPYTPPSKTYALFDDNTNTLTLGYGKYLPDGAIEIDAAKTDYGWIASEAASQDDVHTIIVDESFADFKPTTCYNWFCGLSNLTEIKGIENINTSNVTNMCYMFNYCPKLTAIDLTNFNTENVTDMNMMFSNCSSLTSLDLSSFNTENVTDMGGMFNWCQNLETIYVGDGWITTSETYSSYMFQGCTKLYGGKGTLYAGYESDNALFAHIDVGEDNPGYFTKKGDTKPEFSIAMKTLPQTEFVFGEPFNFRNAEVSLIVENRNPQPIYGIIETNYSGYDNTKLGKQTITVEFSGVTTTYEVTVVDKDAPHAVYDAETKTMTFYYGKHREGATLIGYYDIKNPYAENAEKVVFDKSFANYKPTSCSGWFSGYSNITEIVDMEKYLNTEDVTNMESMFYGCNKLATINLNNFNTSNVVGMDYMFCGCSSLTDIDISGFDTRNVTLMYEMFGSCKQLTSLELGNFNTSTVIDMWGMFDNCTNLKTIFVGDKWNVESVRIRLDRQGPFFGCSNLVGGQGTTYNETLDFAKDFAYAHIDGGTDNSGYLTKSGEDPYVPGEPYAVFDGDHTLTLYYGENKPDGDNVFPVVPQFSYINPHQEKGGSITTVVFDQSFKNYHPTSTAWWFWYDTQLTEIKGLEYLKTDKVTNMSNMFTGCEKLETLDLSGFNTANVKQMEGTFRGCTRLTTILIGDGWNVDKVEDSGNTPFEGCYSLFGSQGTVYSDDATSIKYAHIDGGENNPGYMTKKGTQKVVPLSIKITKYPLQDYSIGQNLSYDGSIAVTFNNGRIVDNIKQFSIIGYDAMQVGKQKLQIEYLGLNTPLEVTVSDKPNGYIILDKSTGIATCYYGKYKEDAYYYTSFPYGDERDAVTKIIFDESFKEFHPEYDCFGNGNFTNLTEIVGIEYLNTDNIKDMTNMFLNCSKLEKVDLSHFITNQATRMDGMFANCTSLTSIDLSTFNTKNVTSMIGFVSGCSNLQTIYVGDNWKSASGIDFFDCNNLVGGKGTHYDAEHTDATYARIDGGASAPGYFTAIVPVSIAIADKPKTEYLEGDDFSTENGTLTVTYNSGRQETIDLSTATISGFDNTKTGEQTITVTYLEKTTYFKVNVAAKSAIAIEITQLPTKLEYIEGEEFVPDGGEFVVTYNNKTSETLELAKATISGFDNTKTGEQTLTVSYLGQKAEIKVIVSPKPEENPYTKPETESDVYMISNLDELLWFVHAVNHGDVKAKAALTRGIVINQNCLKQIAQLFRKKSDDNSNTETATDNLIEWIPIGTPENPFQGTFDGQGHTISGIYFNDASQSNVGLFGNVGNEAVIKNLGVTDSYISGNENVGAICGKSEGTIVNCYTVSVVKGNKNTNSIAGENTENAVVENSFYLAETPVENDPCAKTAAEFKSGDVAKLLAQGATVNGVEYNGNSFSGVVELPGTEDIVVPDNPDNPHTPVSDISDSPIVKVWSFNHTIFIENAPADTKYTIIDLNGRVITTSTTKSSKEEIRTDKTGILLVIIDNQSFKIIN